MTARNALATQSPKLFYNYENKFFHKMETIKYNMEDLNLNRHSKKGSYYRF